MHTDDKKQGGIPFLSHCFNLSCRPNGRLLQTEGSNLAVSVMSCMSNAAT